MLIIQLLNQIQPQYFGLCKLMTMMLGRCAKLPFPGPRRTSQFCTCQNSFLGFFKQKVACELKKARYVDFVFNLVIIQDVTWNVNFMVKGKQLRMKNEVLWNRLWIVTIAMGPKPVQLFWVLISKLVAQHFVFFSMIFVGFQNTSCRPFPRRFFLGGDQMT